MKKFKEYLFMFLGVILMAVGIYFFKIPNGFATGGVSGIATVLGHIQNYLTASELIPIMNILMLILGFVFLGKATGVKTVFCSLLLSALTYSFEVLFPLNSPLTDQPFLELVYGIMLTAIGSAILFNCNASSGGTDITALILKKYTPLDVGKALLVVDFLVAGSSFFVFDVKTGLYSMLGLFGKAFIVDGIIESLNECKSFLITTEKPEEIRKYIIEDMHHSATLLCGEGAHSHISKVVIVTSCKRIEAVKLKRKIKEIDSHSFIIVNSTSEIIGRGFRAI